MCLILSKVLHFILFCQISFTLIVAEPLHNEFGVWYNSTIKIDKPASFLFEYDTSKRREAVRVTVYSHNSTLDTPILVVIKKATDIMSFQVPFESQIYPFIHQTVSRTICPFYLDGREAEKHDQRITVELSTFVSIENDYSVRADIVNNFSIQLGNATNATFTASQPTYYYFEFPKNVDSVSVRLKSDDRGCGIFSIQSARCPVDDLLGNVKYSGQYQTVTTRGSMTITNSVMQDSFIVVLVLKPTEISCNGMAEVMPFPSSRMSYHSFRKQASEKTKQVELLIQPTLDRKDYVWPVFGAIAFYGMFYIFAGVIMTVYHSCDQNDSFINYNVVTRAIFSEYQPLHENSSNLENASTANLVTHQPEDYTTTRYEDNQLTDKGVSFRAPECAPTTQTTVESDAPSQPRKNGRRRKNSRGSPIPINLGVASQAVGDMLQEITSVVSATVSSAVSSTKRRNSDSKNDESERPFSEKAQNRGLFSSSDEEDGLLSNSRVTALSTEERMRERILNNAEQRKVSVASAGTNLENQETAERTLSPWRLENVPSSNPLLREEHMPESEMNRGVSRLNNIFKSQRTLFVSELSKKRYSTLNRKYLLYFWYLIIISIFYSLPVVQLVMTYQNAIHDTGNEDICYYNFECANPLGILTSFNNVISNIGYIMLGLLFLVVTIRRDILQRRINRLHRHHANNYGLPQHYGLFYAMSLALFMEGIMSACYHVCPSYSNFQFDTAYMYILAMILMLKIYQTRHPDINASAHSAYMLMAGVICVGFSGVMYGKETFWVFFTSIFLLLSVCLTAEIYYMGQWNFDLCLPRRIYNLIRVDGLGCFRPMYVERMILLVIANVINFGFAGFGVIWRPPDFSTFLLAIFMVNLVMYFIFYVAMKYRHREKLHCLAVMYLTCAGVFWGFSLYFFVDRTTTWQKTPAESREINHACVLFNFYDSHDIWHFLSSTAMFFSFMALMNLDDDLIHTRRDMIAVF